jgi:hypothetical protein
MVLPSMLLSLSGAVVGSRINVAMKQKLRLGALLIVLNGGSRC